MEHWLETSAGYIGMAVEAMAIVIIAVGSIKAFIAGFGAFLRPSVA